MSREQFEDASYAELRRKLLRSKGSAAQREFLTALRDSGEFAEWIGERVRVEPGDGLPLLEYPLTESEFKEPPRGEEKRMFDAWKSIAPADACRVPFWGLATLRHIEAERIESRYLAADGGAPSGGREKIDRTLREGTASEVDGAVRAALRRMSGLPEARGGRSVYVNCPFARAWWRGHLAREICAEPGAEPGRVGKILAVSQTYWEELVNLVVSRNSVLGDAKVRTALVWALSDCVDDADKKRLFHAKALTRIQRLIGVRSAWQELGVFSVKELKEMMIVEFLAPRRPE